MRPWTRAALVLFLLPITAASLSLMAADPPPESPATPAGPPPDEMLRFLHVPDGFTIELVAGPPLVQRPIMASFDDRGRLYVTDSAGVNLPGRELVKDPPHRIVVLEDTDGDGRFDHSHVFADRIVFPQGLLWHDGAVYVASPPSLWKLEDTTGAGVCDKRTELITGFPLTGVSDDVHGACLGPDGRIYVCSGRFQHHLKDVNGKPIEPGGQQPVLVRCKPDGSEAEVVCGTQGNGVEVAWSEAGDAFVSGTFFGGTGMRDALIHAVEGGDYPVLGHPITAHQMKSTGDLLPPLYHMVATAPAGIMRYRGDALGKEYCDNLLCGYFNTHKVMRHVLTPDGATFRSRNEDFLTSSHPDFHPTDVLQDADGSLLVVNTGGWFRIGCPTSQIAKPDIKGGIYRIRRKDAPVVKDPLGSRINWKNPDLVAWDLVPLLDDPRPPVLERAIEKLARESRENVPALTEVIQAWGPHKAYRDPAAVRRNAVWALTRIDGPQAPEARSAVRTALSDSDASVRQAAAYSAGLHRDAQAAGRLAEMVGRDEPPVRREAAAALGRIGNRSAVPALMAALRGNTDRFLDHSLIYALIRIADRDETAKGLSDPDVYVRRGALLALDQMEGGRLTPDRVTPLLDPAEPLLQKAALQVIGRHGDWGGPMRAYFQQALARAIPEDARREELKQQLAAFATVPDTRDLIAERLHDDATPADVRLLLLEVIAQAPVDRMPEAWAPELARALTSADDRIVRQAVLCARTAPAARRPVLTRTDAVIDFPDTGGPFGATNLSENFGVRWTGQLRVPAAGEYTLFLQSNDGSRLYLDGKLVIDHGGSHAMEEKSGRVPLAAGEHDLRFDYFQAGGTHGCRLLWQRDGTKEVIPAAALQHRTRGADAPTPGLLGRYYRISDPSNGLADLGGVDLDEPLRRIARDDARPADLRVEALSTLGPRLDRIEPGMLDLLLTSLEPSRPALLRTAAADVIARLKLDGTQRRTLIPILAKSGPLEMPKLLAAFENDADAETGRQLVAALNDSPAAKGLRPEVLSPAIAKYPADVHRLAEPLLKHSALDAEQQRAHLAELEPALAAGDSTRGRAIFFGTKAACSTCHTVQEAGGHVGPDLSKIGSIRAPRDLLEAVVYPSASFARGFEPLIVKTQDGDVQSGVISRETADAIYLTTGPREVKRLPRVTIADVRQGTVSVMPQGLDTQLSRQELADLIAFLGSLK